MAQGLTLEELQKMGVKPAPQKQGGLTLQQIQDMQNPKDGFLKSVYKGIAEPVANLIARPGQLVQHAFGDTQPIEGKFLGLDITDPYSRGVSEVYKDIGRGFETVALGVGGGGAVKTLETGTKGLIIEGIKQGTVVGAKSGALIGAGQSLEQGNTDVGKITYDSLFGGVTGALFGGVTGAILPTAVTGKQTAVEMKTGLTTEQGIISKIADRNRKVLNPTQRMSAVEDRFFKDTPNFIAKEYPDMPITITKGKLDLTDGIEGLSNKYNAEELAFDSLLKDSGKYVNLNQVETDAKNQVMKTFSGTQREKALQQVEEEMSAFARQAEQDKYLVQGQGGQFLVPATEGNIFKRSLWQRTKGFGSPESEIYNQSNFVLGSAFKNNLESVIEDAPVKAMNKRLGDFISAIKYLEKRNGSTPGTGGKISTLFYRTMGSIAGATTGGIPGSVAGAITADRLATFLANPEITTSIYNKLLNRLKKEGKMDILRQAQIILNKRAEQATKVLKLPSSGGTSFNPSNIPIILPAPTTYEAMAGKINNPMYIGNKSASVETKIPFTKYPSDTAKLPTIQVGKKPVSKYKQPSNLPIIR